MSDIYEAHLTISSHNNLPIFQQACHALGVKWLQVDLDQGRHPRQLMTVSLHRGTPVEVKKELSDLRSGLESHGFQVRRMKIEANLDNSATDNDFLSSSCYEFHFKILNCGKVRTSLTLLQLPELRSLCQKKGFLLSYTTSENKLGLRREIITLQVAQKSLEFAQTRLAQAVCDLATARFAIEEMACEKVVLDTGSELDEGWSV